MSGTKKKRSELRKKIKKLGKRFKALGIYSQSGEEKLVGRIGIMGSETDMKWTSVGLEMLSNLNQSLIVGM